MKTLVESGMAFHFEEDELFEIERHVQESGKQYIKPCEFVVCPSAGRKAGKILFIEAKTSAPNHMNCRIGEICHNGEPLADNWQILTPLDTYINDICQKFIDTFSLWQATLDGLHSNFSALLPANAKKYDLQSSAEFILIISNFEEDWLPPVNEEIKKKFSHFMSAWHLPPTSIKVVTRQIAVETLGLDIR